MSARKIEKTPKRPLKSATKKRSAAKAAPKEKARANAEAARVAARRGALPAAQVHAIFQRFSDRDPEPKGELDYVNAFTLLVAVVLSAQATDTGVNKATKALFAAADTPQKMLALGEDKVRDFIKTIGLFRNKAKNVILLSQRLIEAFGGEVPRSREELETLPGVGRKTANVVLSIAFGQPTIAVDTHLFRVANRTGIAPGKSPLAVELALEKAVPAEFLVHAHHWLILHGRYVCKAQKPACPTCLIADLCLFEAKTGAPTG
jgi:endonuclease-3